MERLGRIKCNSFIKGQSKCFTHRKNSYPKHKVCGEYISNEVIPYLNFLELIQLKKDKNCKVQISTTEGNLISGELPLGGFGMVDFFGYFTIKKHFLMG